MHEPVQHAELGDLAVLHLQPRQDADDRPTRARRAARRSPGSPSTTARATRRRSTTPCSSPTTPVSACGRCSRRPTATLIRPTSSSLGHVANPVQLVQGPAAFNNDLFYVDMDGGKIHQLSYVPGSQPPTAVAKVTPTSGPTPLTVSYDGTGVHRPAGRSAHLQLEFR